MVEIKIPENPTPREQAYKAWFDELSEEDKTRHFMRVLGLYDGDDAPMWEEETT